MSLIPWKKKIRRNSGLELTSDSRWPHWNFDAVFERLAKTPFSLGPPELWEGKHPLMATDVSESEVDLKVEMDLPGIAPEDVEIDVEDGLLTIRGHRREDHEESKRDYYRVERSFGSVSRTVELPPSADPDNIEATFKGGVLTVTIPKKESAKATRIEVKSS